MNRLSESEWRKRAGAQRQDALRWTGPLAERRKNREVHPVHDFLFVYYAYSSRKLEIWHPGVGFELEVAQPQSTHFSARHYQINSGLVRCDPELMTEKERVRLEWSANLLRQTDARKPNFSCLGLHEWAMVYRGKEVRHEKTTRLRLSREEIDRVVESRPLTCTHFDAFRFYALQARPLNRHQPTLESRVEMEQPACIHANMDLYKWAYKAMPWVGSDLMMRCFELAMKAREIDMRASPYDLSNYPGFPPICIETPGGRAEYEQHQRQIADQATPLRRELASAIEQVVECVGSNA